MIITKCDKQCIFVNMVGYCCLDNHITDTKHTEEQCQRGQARKAELNMSLSLSYRLGYNRAKAPKDSINYQEEMHIPINSFSNPEVQIPQYVQGWKDGRKC